MSVFPGQSHLISAIDVDGSFEHYNPSMTRPKVKETIFRLTCRNPHVRHVGLELRIYSCVTRVLFS